MAPTLPTACGSLPPEGAGLAWGGPALRPLAPTLVTACTSLPLEGAAAPAVWRSQSRGPCLKGEVAATLGMAPTLPTARTPRLCVRAVRGFTLIELLVAIGVMALMAGLSWRGLDGMVRAQTQISQRADALLTLQAGLAQWAADLEAVVELPQTVAMDWDGRGLRMTRRSMAAPGDGVLVVAWASRNVDGTNQWLRWQSPALYTRAELQSAWRKAAQWAQNPGEEEKKYEVRITAVDQWQIFYFRGNAWSNPLSSEGAAAPGAGMPLAAGPVLPDGVRLVLTLPAGEAITGVLTRDWVRPVVGGGKS